MVLEKYLVAELAPGSASRATLAFTLASSAGRLPLLQLPAQGFTIPQPLAYLPQLPHQALSLVLAVKCSGTTTSTLDVPWKALMQNLQRGSVAKQVTFQGESLTVVFRTVEWLHKLSKSDWPGSKQQEALTTYSKFTQTTTGHRLKGSSGGWCIVLLLMVIAAVGGQFLGSFGRQHEVAIKARKYVGPIVAQGQQQIRRLEIYGSKGMAWVQGKGQQARAEGAALWDWAGEQLEDRFEWAGGEWKRLKSRGSRAWQWLQSKAGEWLGREERRGRLSSSRFKLTRRQ